MLSLTPIFVKTLIKESRFYAPIFSRYLIVLVVEKLERFGFWIITAFAGSHYALFTWQVSLCAIQGWQIWIVQAEFGSSPGTCVGAFILWAHIDDLNTRLDVPYVLYADNLKIYDQVNALICSIKLENNNNVIFK